MGPTQLVAEAEAVASRGDGISITKIVGEELREKGYGGVYGVGKGREGAAGVGRPHGPTDREARRGIGRPDTFVLTRAG